MKVNDFMIAKLKEMENQLGAMVPCADNEQTLQAAKAAHESILNLIAVMEKESG